MEYKALLPSQLLKKASLLKGLRGHRRAFLLQARNGDLIVAKFTRSKGSRERYSAASAFLRERDIPVPTLLNQHYTWEGHRLLIEEFIDGKHLSEVKLTERSIEKLVASLKKMHQIESDSWGRVDRRRRRKGYFRHTLRKIEDMVIKDEVIKEKIERCEWLSEVVERLEQADQAYQFIHGDLHGENIVLADERVWFIDLIRSGFGSYVKDLVRIDLWEWRSFKTHRIRERYLRDVCDPLLYDRLSLFYLEALVRDAVKYKRDTPKLEPLLRNGAIP